MSSTQSLGPVRIATRGSALALAQSRMVQARCATTFPGRGFDLAIIKTTGDRRQAASMNRPAPDLPKGLFTKELEVALLAGKADFAVHSLKDLPTELPVGLRLGAVLTRADPRDVLIVRRSRRAGARRGLRDLPEGATVATSSTRRAAQIQRLRPDLKLVEIRGNVPTRLRKLAETKEFDATILAAAGLARLGIRRDATGRLRAPQDLADPGWGDQVLGIPIPLSQMLPAPGQAAIGIECRQGDPGIARICRSLNDPKTMACVVAERAFLAGFGGGCHSPVAALAEVNEETLRLRVIAFSDAGCFEAVGSVPVGQARSLGLRLGRDAKRALGRTG